MKNSFKMPGSCVGVVKNYGVSKKKKKKTINWWWETLLWNPFFNKAKHS